MRYLYTLLLALLAPFLLFSLYRSKEGKPKIGQRWIEHFGVTPPLKTTLTEKPIWVHAVSVGETIAAKPIILALRQQYPTIPIVISTTTTTGAQIATQLAQQVENLEHRFMPIDFPFAIKGFIGSIKPQKLLIMETELWPNTLHMVHKAGVKLIVINARLSQNAANNYRKIKLFFAEISDNIDHICCQFQEDRDRFLSLGVKSNKLSICGSVKFDLAKFDDQQEKVKTLKSQLSARAVWIASSTHTGEDEIILSAHQKVLKAIPNALLILVPRHPERFNDVANLIKANDLTLNRRSEDLPINERNQVFLGDSMGEMMTLFAVSDIAFMAGSLLGDKVGGHNLLEPASLGKALLIGPSYYNFQFMGDELIKAGACLICQSEQEIAQNVIMLLQNSAQREVAGKNALEIVEKNRGAVEKIIKTLT